MKEGTINKNRWEKRQWK